MGESLRVVSGFNPRTPCGVRPGRHEYWSRSRCFNPRTPCGVRRAHELYAYVRDQFQSTHSLRSATAGRVRLPRPESVSIHALLAECDPLVQEQGFVSPVSIHALLAECDGTSVDREFIVTGFNPRTPCGVRRSLRTMTTIPRKFQSTHSLRSATAPDHIHCYSTAQTILCANLPKKAIIT